MKFSDAVRHYEQGKAIRVTDWPVGNKLDPNDRHSVETHLNVGTFDLEWELYKEPEIRLSEIKDGELFEYNDIQYRKMPSYMQEYHLNSLEDMFPVLATVHFTNSDYKRGEFKRFSNGCLVKRVS